MYSVGLSQGFQWLRYLLIQAAAGRGVPAGEWGGGGVARRHPLRQQKVAREKRTASSDGSILGGVSVVRATRPVR